MAAQTLFVLDQDAKDEIKALHVKIDRLLTLMLNKDEVRRGSLDFKSLSYRSLSEESDTNPLLTSDDFCKRYDIHPVEMRRMAKEGKYIERIQLGARTFRYRLKTDGTNDIKGGDQQEQQCALSEE